MCSRARSKARRAPPAHRTSSRLLMTKPARAAANTNRSQGWKWKGFVGWGDVEGTDLWVGTYMTSRQKASHLQAVDRREMPRRHNWQPATQNRLRLGVWQLLWQPRDRTLSPPSSEAPPHTPTGSGVCVRFVSSHSWARATNAACVSSLSLSHAVATRC